MELEITSKNISIQGEVLNTKKLPIIYLYASIDLTNKTSQIQWNIGDYEEYVKEKEMCYLKINEFQSFIDEEVNKLF